MRLLPRIFLLLLLAFSASAQARTTTFDGVWCGSGLLAEFSLRLAQKYQDVTGTITRRDRVRELRGRVEGNQLHTQATKVGALVLERHGDALKIVGGEGQLAMARGMIFNRAAGESCR